jgi:hypothetical protein
MLVDIIIWFQYWVPLKYPKSTSSLLWIFVISEHSELSPSIRNSVGVVLYFLCNKLGLITRITATEFNHTTNIGAVGLERNNKMWAIHQEQRDSNFMLRLVRFHVLHNVKCDQDSIHAENPIQKIFPWRKVVCFVCLVCHIEILQTMAPLSSSVYCWKTLDEWVH